MSLLVERGEDVRPFVADPNVDLPFTSGEEPGLASLSADLLSRGSIDLAPSPRGVLDESVLGVPFSGLLRFRDRGSSAS